MKSQLAEYVRRLAIELRGSAETQEYRLQKELHETPWQHIVSHYPDRIAGNFRSSCETPRQAAICWPYTGSETPPQIRLRSALCVFPRTSSVGNGVQPHQNSSTNTD